jgi:hypothetical protein
LAVNTPSSAAFSRFYAPHDREALVGEDVDGLIAAVDSQPVHGQIVGFRLPRERDVACRQSLRCSDPYRHIGIDGLPSFFQLHLLIRPQQLDRHLAVLCRLRQRIRRYDPSWCGCHNRHVGGMSASRSYTARGKQDGKMLHKPPFDIGARSPHARAGFILSQSPSALQAPMRLLSPVGSAGASGTLRNGMNQWQLSGNRFEPLNDRYVGARGFIQPIARTSASPVPQAERSLGAS